MTLSFNIEYRTCWGEEVRIVGLSSGSLPMHTSDGIYWTAETELDIPSVGKTICYSYQIERDGIVVRREWNGFPRSLFVIAAASSATYRIYDHWRDIPEQSYLYSSAFTEVWLARPERDVAELSGNKKIVIKVYAPGIGRDCTLAICGNRKLLGNWKEEEALVMSDANFPEWQIALGADQLDFPVEYKFILRRGQEKRAECWEQLPNRQLNDLQIRDNETVVISVQDACFDIPAWRGAGVAVPVFSLRSEGSFGIGDFGDLKLLVDWVAATHQKIIQILPINDTTMTHTWADSYPYNSISIYALHPIYADLRQMGQLKDQKAAAQFNEKQKELNALTTIDYEAVNRAKWELFQLLFEQNGAETLASADFLTFFKSNKEWLQPYAAFCCLRDSYHTPDFRRWGRHSVYKRQTIERMCRLSSAYYPRIALHYYIQYHLHRQLLAATRYARRKGVVVKGDIPIGISRNSVEAWTEPHYFNLNGQAGAPPDDFSTDGQNWGFPTYNWDVMSCDGYRWWIQRFQKMAVYFDAYRIDHILGFFRIWEIPVHAVHGLLGQFSPSLPMTREEIESYGLPFREEWLHPSIHEDLLKHLFGEHAHSVKQRFLEATDRPDVYRMKPEFATQRDVQAYFAGRSNDAGSIRIRDGLYTLISNVLFLPDAKEKDRYHPRICAERDFVFRSLSKDEQDAFRRLHEHYYYQRHNEFWYQQAMQKLPCLTQSTRMLVCGEDLGMIPGDCIARVMNELRILSLEVQRMPKSMMHEFGLLKEYPYLSVCTISTHDMSTLREWWEEDYNQTQRFYHLCLERSDAAPQVATPEVCEAVVRQHLGSNSMLCILSLQDWLSIDGKWRNPQADAERINVPSDPHHYWRYRMHLTLEQLLGAQSLNEKIRRLVK